MSFVRKLHSKIKRIKFINFKGVTDGAMEDVDQYQEEDFEDFFKMNITPCSYIVEY